MTGATSCAPNKFRKTWTICVLAAICVFYASAGEAANFGRRGRDVIESSDASNEHRIAVNGDHADENAGQPSDNGSMADEVIDEVMEEMSSAANEAPDHENSVNSLGTAQNNTALNTTAVAQNAIDQVYVEQRSPESEPVMQSRNGSDKALELPSDGVANENGLANDRNEFRKNR